MIIEVNSQSDSTKVIQDKLQFPGIFYSFRLLGQMEAGQSIK